MRHPLLKIALFTLVLIASDVLIGKIMSHLAKSAVGSYTRHYALTGGLARDSIMIFGSSRASHHYDSGILSDSLGVPVYNAGSDGNGIVLAYLQLSKLVEQHRPRLIVLDLYDRFDWLAIGDNVSFLKAARLFYGNDESKQVFESIAPAEKYKMMSGAYRYNSLWLQIVKDNISANPIGNGSGYLPLHENMSSGHSPDNEWIGADVDSVRIMCLDRFLALCHDNDIPVMAFISPYYFEKDTELTLRPVKALLDGYGVTVTSYLSDPEFCGNDSLFADPGHMNDHGATKFTRSILPLIRSTYERNTSLRK